MKYKLRIARGTNDLKRISEMYRTGLGLAVVSSFGAHQGFEGVMLGYPGSDYHFEFTVEEGVSAPPSHSVEALAVFYCGSELEYNQRKTAMVTAGFREVAAHNPYWSEHGTTYEDFENYRVVICRNSWGA